ISEFQYSRADYASNVLPPTYPDGLDTEVFTRAVLETAHLEARLPSEREHVTPFVYHHPERFRLHNVEHREDLSAWRWTVDETADLELVRIVYEHFGDGPFDLEDVVRFIRGDLSLLN